MSEVASQIKWQPEQNVTIWIYNDLFCNHCPPTYGEEWGMAGLKGRAITFRVSSECRGNDRVLTLGSLHQGDFLLQRAGQRAKCVKGRAKSKVLTSNLPPGDGAHRRALKAKKS